MSRSAKSSNPRALLLSATGPGSPSATGALLDKLFCSWSEDNLLSITATLPSAKAYRAIHLGDLGARPSLQALTQSARDFSPDVVYYRPIQEPLWFHETAQQLIEELSKPYVVHVMDDWPRRMASEQPELATTFLPEFESFLSSASCCLSISQAMSTVYQQRYGRCFYPVANGIDPEDCRTVKVQSKRLSVLYSGALADDMSRVSVAEIAQSISTLSRKHNISLEIRTMPWFQEAARELARLPGVRNKPMVPNDRYLSTLHQADCLLIAYNFDHRSTRYTELSMANKLPECLASGTPVLAYGPESNATIALLEQSKAGMIVKEQSQEALATALLTLLESPQLRETLATQAIHFAQENLSIADIRRTFEEHLKRAASIADIYSEPSAANIQPTTYLQGPYEREHQLSIQEELIVANLLKAAAPGTMIDVGAHHGNALLPFYQMGWTIHAFEPDPANRKQLSRRFRKRDLLTIDPRAVSDVDNQTVDLFVSNMSSGISGLSAFTESHRKAGEVKTVTLARYIAESNMQAVDFLKIDTEGFDLMVLKGFPWDQMQPSIILCEFEDAKTTPLGYQVEDLISYLGNKGYEVFVSEWHPIVQYGMQHHWRGLLKHSSRPSNESAWGNLMAFHHTEQSPNTPTQERLLDSVASAVSSRNTEPSATPVHSHQQPEANKPRKIEPMSRPSLFSTIANYCRMLFGFYSSVPGVIVLALLLVAYLGWQASIILEAPLSYIGICASVLALLFMPAYLYARIKHEQDIKTSDAFSLASSRATRVASTTNQHMLRRTETVENRLAALADSTSSLEQKLSGPNALQAGDIHALQRRHTALETTLQELATTTSELESHFSEIAEEHNQALEQIVNLRGQLLSLKKTQQVEAANTDD